MIEMSEMESGRSDNKPLQLMDELYSGRNIKFRVWMRSSEKITRFTRKGVISHALSRTSFAAIHKNKFVFVSINDLKFVDG
jgi:hypothetical protein